MNSNGTLTTNRDKAVSMFKIEEAVTLKREILYLFVQTDQQITELDNATLVNHMKDLRKKHGAYEKFMKHGKNKQEVKKYWLASAIVMCDLALSRIQRNKFSSANLKKLHRNATTRKLKEPKHFKNDIVNVWEEVTKHRGIDPRIFHNALKYGMK